MVLFKCVSVKRFVNLSILSSEDESCFSSPWKEREDKVSMELLKGSSYLCLGQELFYRTFYANYME